VRATLEAEVQRDAIAAGQRDVFQQQPHHPFSFAVGRGRITPQLREAAGERKDRCSLLIADHLPILFPLTFTKLLRFNQHLQLGVPIGLERIGYEPIVRVHPQITSACQLGFIT